MRKIREDYTPMVYQNHISQKNMVLREQSPVDPFHVESCIGSYDGEESQSFCNPIQMLFNQIRLDNIGEQSLKQWLEGQPEDSAIKELLSKCSPDDIMATIKSRYLQQPSEIRAWAEYTSHNMDKFNSELAAALEAKTDETVIQEEDKPQPE